MSLPADVALQQTMRNAQIINITTNVLEFDDCELRDALAIIVAFGSDRFGYLRYAERHYFEDA